VCIDGVPPPGMQIDRRAGESPHRERARSTFVNPGVNGGCMMAVTPILMADSILVAGELIKEGRFWVEIFGEAEE
jgi:hypothetical protein